MYNPTVYRDATAATSLSSHSTHDHIIPLQSFLKKKKNLLVAKQCSVVSAKSLFHGWLHVVCPESSQDSPESLSKYREDDPSPPAWTPSATQSDPLSPTAVESRSPDDHHRLPRRALRPRWWWASPRTSSTTADQDRTAPEETAGEETIWS